MGNTKTQDRIQRRGKIEKTETETTKSQPENTKTKRTYSKEE